MCACNELHMRAGCGKSACPVRRGLRKAVILPHSSVTLLASVVKSSFRFEWSGLEICEIDSASGYFKSRGGSSE